MRPLVTPSETIEPDYESEPDPLESGSEYLLGKRSRRSTPSMIVVEREPKPRKRARVSKVQKERYGDDEYTDEQDRPRPKHPTPRRPKTQTSKAPPGAFRSVKQKARPRIGPKPGSPRVSGDEDNSSEDELNLRSTSISPRKEEQIEEPHTEGESPIRKPRTLNMKEIKHAFSRMLDAYSRERIGVFATPEVLGQITLASMEDLAAVLGFEVNELLGRDVGRSSRRAADDCSTHDSSIMTQVPPLSRSLNVPRSSNATLIAIPGGGSRAKITTPPETSDPSTDASPAPIRRPQTQTSTIRKHTSASLAQPDRIRTYRNPPMNTSQTSPPLPSGSSQVLAIVYPAESSRRDRYYED